MSGALAGRRIVITRPAGQIETLADLVRADDGTPIVFPVIEIRDVADIKPLAALIDRLDDFDVAIFISANAVAKAMNLVQSRRTWPRHVRVATIGKGSEKALRRFGFSEIVAPTGRFDSEALLELAPLAEVAGKRIVIFRGDGGRELLGDTLTARGAAVEYAECYRRVRPDADVAPLLKLWARGELDAITVTSREGLHNLYDMVGKLGQQWLRRTPTFAPHARIVAGARALGLERVVETGAGDEGLAEGLRAFFGKVHQDR
jgi:uroporphyrinogen-III synthase